MHNSVSQVSAEKFAAFDVSSPGSNLSKSFIIVFVCFPLFVVLVSILYSQDNSSFPTQYV